MNDQRIWIIECFHDNDEGIFASFEAAKAFCENPENHVDYPAESIESWTLVGDKYEKTPDDQCWRWCTVCKKLFQYIDQGHYTCFEHFDRCPEHWDLEEIAKWEKKEAEFKAKEAEKNK